MFFGQLQSARFVDLNDHGRSTLFAEVASSVGIRGEKKVPPVDFRVLHLDVTSPGVKRIQSHADGRVVVLVIGESVLGVEVIIVRLVQTIQQMLRVEIRISGASDEQLSNE